jgi:hypothetical protein
VSLQTVPLSVTPNQSFSVVLNDRDVSISLRTLQGALYADVVCDGVPVCAGQLCLDRVEITLRSAYLGFPDLSLTFADLRGTSDPEWSEFGTRYVLLNATPAPVNTDDQIGPTPRPPVILLLADGTYFADGSQIAIGVVTT